MEHHFLRTLISFIIAMKIITLLTRLVFTGCVCLFYCLIEVSALSAFSSETTDVDKWELSGGTGTKIDGGILQLTGTGTDSNSWFSPPFPIQPSECYRFSMEARKVGDETAGTGTAPCGIEGFSRDFADITSEWKSYTFVFKSPENKKEARLRVGQWMSKSTFQFRNIKFHRIVPIPTGLSNYNANNNDSNNSSNNNNNNNDVNKNSSTSDTLSFLQLGDGEILRNGQYRFCSLLGGVPGNSQRPFLETTTGFNSNRFVFGSEQEVLCEWGLRSGLFQEEKFYKFLRGRLRVNVNYHVSGECIVEAIRLDKNASYIVLGSLDKVGCLDLQIPESLLPSESVGIRIRASNGGYFQVDQIDFEADVDPDCAFSGAGETIYADVTEMPENPILSGYTSYPLFFDANRTLYVLHQNNSDVAVKPIPVNPPDRLPKQYKERFFTLSPPFDAKTGTLPAKSKCFETKPLSLAPEYVVPCSHVTLKYSFPYNSYRDARFGYGIAETAGTKPAQGIWWCEPDWKVSPNMTDPMTLENSRGGKVAQRKPIQISAAKNDIESVQIVVNGENTGRKSVSLELEGDLVSENGGIIPRTDVLIRYVYYHFVERPTDSTGLIGEWPDALPPLENPLDIAPHKNQPFWVSVPVTKNAKSGLYNGTLLLKWNENDQQVQQQIPLQLKIWDFALPDKNTLETAFGIDHGNIFKYHRLKTESDRRAVLEMYSKNYSDNRISVYNHTPLDPIRVVWKPENNPPQAEIDTAAFEKEMERVFDRYNVTGFRLHIEGLGSGGWEGGSPGSIAGFKWESPEYEAMLSDYLKKLESFLKRKGWLDKAYIYWYDEPQPPNYEMVAKGFAKLQKYAPSLRRMITVEPNSDFIAALEKAGATIDIWCPLSNYFNEETAKQRQEKGERFWWYVCTGPKAPFCTLFIDHPGIELRMWHWQAWQRNVVGSLIWESTYWTSPGAFPETPQNPYQDPMGYVSNSPPNAKQIWGNGDGRFVYPPLDVFDPNLSGPVLKGPVASIRWEMLREGIEDYEMLSMLREMKSKHPESAEKIDAILSIPAEISSSMTKFSIDPTPIYQKRNQVAEMIEKLQSNSIVK
ncbi:MAG: glycoside hydrolase domain-containing protein [Thermoguttaceae bacterium]